MMAQTLTHENFLKLKPTPAEGALEFHVPPPTRAPRSMIDESIRAAQLISNSTHEKIFLPFSGGIDSEAMVEAFARAKIDFTAVILEYRGLEHHGVHNEYDIGEARRYCQKHSIKAKVLTVDLDTFFESKQHLKIAEDYQCRSPQIAVHLHGLSQVEGCLVFPHNPIALYNRGENFYWEFPQNLYFSYDRFFENRDQTCVSFFFLYTRELIYSYACLPIYRELLTRDRKFWNVFSRDPYLIKCELYRQGGFQARPKRGKATGFEEYRRHLNRLHKGHYKDDFFDENYRQPMERAANDRGHRHLGKIDLQYLYSLWQTNNQGTFE